ncbi:hypothetical protein JQU17_12040 [Ponticoccus sp. SC2-23]|uniref:hypothetical protein n=1 Tax=Alexandriicola marinus TaxID=2081710 RepID=UPI000FD9785B|nr:hypothetical protein [Alexandriicola marinus]MBM1221626.1 hypothetical protein [Ponticoccus sp. SC6-9]MBM1226667.1 hypothetical protein [Ponticoccus sp. SC6-15]MBM1230618.1 hypothetical protein [Ponticoccus sp. SC6-38]MBM1235141.1 hypothetical protein [Ponticoccus sp. SC6-45]MBM1239639.1 hypothetical protein [Ponticoccus sp. SC6-49]MBM1243421.1 hypothetical protein [Ponticoccus sp. SC2-64]MBM1248665.1 hypothetical protein [Ponticoccus sp. SC6-42]MBM1253250.1 hypothetical protein [Pontico
MSDPVTNIQIEDVLSSIRRLVSEGEKLRDPGTSSETKSSSKTGAASPEEEPGVLELGAEYRADIAGPDGREDAGEGDRSEVDNPVRFVLTPAYRVEEPEPQEWLDETDTADTQADTTADAGPENAEADEEGDDAGLRGEIVWTDEDDPEAAVTSDTAPDTPAAKARDDGGVPEAEKTDQVPEWVARGQAELDALESEGADPEAGLTNDAALQGDDDLAGPSGQDTPAQQTAEIEIPAPEAEHSDRRAIESTIAELEAAISGAAEEWEPDGSEETPVMDWDAASEVGVFFSSRFASGGPVEDAEMSDTPDQRDETDPEDAAEKFEAAEAYFAEAEIEDAPDPLEDQLTAYLEQDEVLDEETLRRMVAEIVREELQGPLGERITRNVRKLVRREIYRALAEQGFE